MKLKTVAALLLLIIFCTPSFAQAPADTVQLVEILQAKKLQLKTIGVSEVQILSGGVRLKQGTTLFSCDSCIFNPELRLIEAFGRVHINDSDTSHVYSNTLRYHTDRKYAYLRGAVRLTDAHSTLTTNELEYDVNNGIGIYKNGGKVVSRKSVLTSREGTYYSDLKDFYFRHNVVLKDPSYSLRSDSLLYNTQTQMARFIAETFIKDSSGRTIRTSEGFYDLAASRAEFTSRTEIHDKSLFAIADEIASDDKSGIIQLKGRAVMRDTAAGQSVLAGEIYINKNTNAFLATRKPLMIVKQERDSIYVTADTLFSARLTDLYPNDTTLKFKDPKDSTNRYFEGYRNVRVFSDSVQAVSDSLFYSFRDSSFRLFYDPIVWSNKNQITGDTIFLYTKNKKADRIRVINNSFLVSEMDPGVYNQIKANRLDGYFRAGVIDSVRAKGMAESVYFLQDEDSAYTNVNQTSSDAIDIYFLKGDLDKVVLRSGVKGNLTPLSQKSPSQARLAEFRWLHDRRPKTKYELFE
jgi:lipopolysaccharide export system protein LptA